MTPVSQYWFTFGHFCRKARALSIFGHERDNIMLGCSWHLSGYISWLLVRLLVLWALGCNRLDWWFVDSQTPSFSPSLSNISFRSRDRNSRGFSGQLVGFSGEDKDPNYCLWDLNGWMYNGFYFVEFSSLSFLFLIGLYIFCRVAEVVQFQFQGSSISIPVFQRRGFYL